MPRAALKAKNVSLPRTARVRSEKRIEVLNKKLSTSIDVDKLLANTELFVIGENGVVMNFNPDNPQHKKWLED